MATQSDLYIVVSLIEALTAGEFRPDGRLALFCEEAGYSPAEVGEAVQRLGNEAGEDEVGWTAEDCEDW